MSEIINTHDQLLAARAAGLPDASITKARLPASDYWAGWHVYRPGFKTDPSAAWYDNGCKYFSGRIEGLAAAKEWASTKYGIKEWKANRMRDLVDARVARRFPLKVTR